MVVTTARFPPGAVKLKQDHVRRAHARCWPTAGTWVAGYYFLPQKAVRNIIELLKRKLK